MPMLSFRRKKQSTTIQSSEISESGKRNSSSIESIRSSTAGIDEMISTRNSSAGLEFSRSKSDIQLAPPSPTRSKSDNYITVMSRRHQGQLNHQTSNNGSVVSLFSLSKLRRSFDDFRDSLVDSSHGSSSDKEVNNEKLSLLETSVKDTPLLQLPKLVSFQNNNPIEITNEIPSISVEPADIETESNHGSPLLNAICEDSVQSSIERCEETTNLSKGRNTKGILTTSSERKISLFSLSNANETSFRGPLLKFKKNKTVSKFFSLDDMLPGSMEPLQTSSNHESDISSHIQEEFASEQSSGDSSAIGPTDSRPFPLLRSLSSQSQENRDVSTDSKKTKVENRRRSRTLNSLIAENRTVAPISRPSFSSLFGSKLRSDSDPRSFNKRHSHSPRPSLSTPQEDKILLPERTYHTEDEYLRLLQNKEYGGNTALILSCQDDSFYLSVLQKYTDTFNFKDEPVDMALRKFLMYVKLPKETQQIDRILECFASTYHRQNDSIYGDSETAYIVVFSLMILHTDFFNKNNKHKMQRNDYVRNTYANGVSREILEVSNARNILSLTISVF